MQDIGQVLLLLTFFATLTTALTAAAGALSRSASLMRGARFGVVAVALLNVAMAIVLTHGFLTHDFSNKYITAYSDRTMPTMYLLASFWGGEKGALLFWTTSLSIFSAIALHTRRHRDPAYLAWVTCVLMLALFFFDILMVFESSPFETFSAMTPPADGKGLNPQLQNPTMAFHPPALLTGYITFTIPYAFAMGALITGKLDVQWITDTRVWTIISWCFLSIGLILGMLWAYEELGWGFYWMWDPVENAGAIPWFTGTAFLHSVMIQERRGMLKRWNVLLVCLTFLLTIAGTFLTRSQLIDSIHAFANSTLAEYFLWYMLIIVIISGALIAWRWGALRSEARIESIYSRESMFVLNNLFLVGCAFIVSWGTIFPKLSELASVQGAWNGVAAAWNGTVGGLLGEIEPITQALTLGEVWFNTVIAPIGIILLILMGFGPLIPWRIASLRSYRRHLFLPLTVALVTTGIGSGVLSLQAIWRLQAKYELTFSQAFENWSGSLGTDHVYVVMAYVFIIYVAWTILREFHSGARVRQEKSGDGYMPSMVALTLKTPRRYGGYMIHMGVVLMFVAFTGKVFKDQQPEKPLSPGDQIASAHYRMTYAGSEHAWDADNGYARTQASIIVLREGETVAERQVDDLAAWLAEREVGVFHVETRPENPKMFVRFANQASRDLLRDDVFLAKSFQPDFIKVGEDPTSFRQTWRVRDQGLLGVMPMLAMQKIRAVRSALGVGSTVGASIEARGGSPEVALVFPTAAAMAAFDQRIAGLHVPDSLIYGGYDPGSGALAFIDRATGRVLRPEVRFYAKHDTPTTETAISSTLFEDLYLAMRPARGQDFINLLTVVFPLVSFLWAGSILMVIGTLVVLIPRWLAQTLIRLTRGPRQAVPSGPALAATASTLLLLIALAWPSHAAPPPEPSGMAPPPAGAEIDDVLGTLTCPCGATLVGSGLTTADPECQCLRALADRDVVTGLMREQPRSLWSSGRAKLNVLYRVVEIDPTYDARLRFDPRTYDHILTHTKTVCPGERGLVLSQSQLACSVRNKWFPRFRVMLAAGMSEQAIYRFYVDESNVTMAPSTPWSYADLRSHADKPLSWAFPALLLVSFLFGLVFVARRKVRANAALAASTRAARVETLGEDGADAANLTTRQRLLLEDELDLLDV